MGLSLSVVRYENGIESEIEDDAFDFCSSTMNWKFLDANETDFIDYDAIIDDCPRRKVKDIDEAIKWVNQNFRPIDNIHQSFIKALVMMKADSNILFKDS